jgi:hypothetical protein
MATNKITKGDLHKFVKEQLSSNEKWAKAALLRIFDYQTRDEKITESTNCNNNVGFTGCDAEILTSFAKQLIRKNFLSPKQMILVFKKMPKYHGQIIDISDEDKLKQQVESWKKEQTKIAAQNSAQLSLNI